jgi:hypothetical protein
LPQEIIIDGMEEHAFRRSIEIMLRDGRADEAVERLKALLPECAGEGKILPARLLELSPEHINLGGWDRLAAKVEEYSRPTIPITAVGIGIGDPADSGLEPDAVGNLRPPLATSYYSDATFPFSETDRADLLEGYSSFGCEWQGDHDRIDDTLSIEGIDDLYGAIARLENEVATSERPDPELIRAGAIGACYLGVMVWKAARRAVIEQGLPRPMAILLVNSDAYPFFDAPVMTCDEYLDDGALQVVEHQSAERYDDAENEEAEAGSLLDIAGLGAHRASAKKMALVLDGDEAHNPLGMADDMVAQAAFEPDSVDVSRFLPDASEFQNRPELEIEPEPEPEPEPFAELAQQPDPEPEAQIDPSFHDEAFDEPEYPVETAPCQEPEDAAEDSAPIAEAAGSPSDLAPQLHDDPAPAPSPAAWQPPEWATEMPDLPAAAARESSGTGTVWQAQASDLPFDSLSAPRAPTLQPASHSIRARIRTSPQEETPVVASGSLIARFIGWLGKLFTRR